MIGGKYGAIGGKATKDQRDGGASDSSNTETNYGFSAKFILGVEIKTRESDQEEGR